MFRAAVPERPRRFLRRLLALALLVTAGLATAGCVTQSSNESAEPSLSPSDLRVVGYVVWVDASENTAVIEVRRGATLSNEPMTARNDALVQTARLQLTEIRQGHTLGVRILEGLPNAGDEVVLQRAGD